MSDDGATTKDVERLARGWDNNTLECRSYGHQWRPQTAKHFKKQRYWYVVRVCARCTTERHEELNEFGASLASWYRYAEGYLTEGIGRIMADGRAVLRLQTVMRTFSITTITRADDEERPHSIATRRAIGWAD